MSIRSLERRQRFAAEAATLLGPDAHTISQRERYRRLQPLLVRYMVRTWMTTIIAVLGALIIAVVANVPALIAAIVIGAGACSLALISSFRTRAVIMWATQNPEAGVRRGR